ncbi:MAG: divalent cation transporter [Gammaproteobacteria bacterium]|nr:divalent cation transporter [Gammaproteobacteria bacterium]
MSEWMQLLFFTTLAGAAIPAGGLLGMVERIRPYWLEQEFRHSVIAIGGGALLAAVAFVLVPEGMHRLPVWAVLASVLGGGVAMMLLERWLARHGGSVAQFIAMLLDFLPESIALGALYAEGLAAAPLLALLIAVQNFPEGFNAQRELRDAGLARWQTLLLFLLLVPLGPAMATAGKLWLVDFPAVLGIIMLAAAGGILYLIFQDIAPQARLQRHWGPPLGAVIGFLIGLGGHLMIG